MSGDWQRGSVALKYRLGEITLFTAVFEALICGRQFSDVRPDELPELPAPGSDTRIGLCLIRSQPVSGALPRLSSGGGWIRYVPQQYKRYYVDLSGGFDDYLRHFSSKTRSTLTRKVRKFAEASGGEIDWREYRSPEEIDAFYAMAREVSRKTYQERLLDAGLPVEESLRLGMREAAARSEVRAYLLFLAGQPIAYVYCPLRVGILVYEYVGFDPAHQQLSPGTVLQYLILKRLYDEGGYRIFDFTEGEGQQKSFFSTHHVLCADIYMYRATLRNALAVRLHAWLDCFSGITGAALDRMGLKATIKRLVRRYA